MIPLLSRRVLENPQVGRQAPSKLHSFPLGLTLLIATAGLLATGLSVFSVHQSEERSLTAASFGAVLHLFNAAATWAILALVLPFQATGSVDRLRADKAFDQIVVTGWSPLELHFGNWALGMAIALAILLASLPFQVFAWSLGGVSLGDMAITYLVLAFYAGLIIVAAQGLAMFQPESAAALFTVCWLLAAGALGVTARFAGIGELTPLRFILRRHADGMGIPGVFGSESMLFGWTLPSDVYAVICWAVIALVAVVPLLVGPYHRFTPGLDNFGNVVLPGIWKARFFLRARQQLARRVDLAFFYENRPRALDRWDFVLRKVPVLVAVTFLWGIITAAFLRGGVLGLDRRFGWNPEARNLMMWSFAIAFFGLLALGESTRTRNLLERVGPFRAPRGALLSLCALVILAGFLALHVWVLEGAASGGGGVPPAPEEELIEYRGIAAAFLLFLGSTYLLRKVLSGWAALGAAGLLFLGPAFILAGIEAGWCPPRAFPAVLASPGMLTTNKQSFFKLAFELGYERRDMVRVHAAFHMAIAGMVVAVMAWRWLAARRRAAHPPRAGKPAAVALLGVALLFLPAAPARAEEPALELELVQGFEGWLAEDQVLGHFYTLVIRNRGPRAVEGTLRMEAPGGLATPRRPFEAPAGTSTVVRWREDEGALFAATVAELVLEGSGWTRRVDMPATRAFATQDSASAGGESRRAYLLVSEDRRLPSTVAQTHAWVPARPMVLPETWDSYSGLSAVLVVEADLSRWTQGQRDALHDYLRMGGSVVFAGALDRASLEGAGQWKDLLAPAETARIQRGTYEITDGALAEGAPAWRLPPAAAGPETPLLHWRRVGPGTLSRLGFDPRRVPQGLVAELGGSDALWSAFEEEVPSSIHLSKLRKTSGERPIADPSGFTTVLAYFGAYVFIIGPLLALLFRKKERRRWMPLYVCGAPVLFSIGLPFVEASLHARPSPALMAREAYFGARSRSGVAYATLLVRSNGRQAHRVVATGEDLMHHALGPGRIRWSDVTRLTGAAPAEIDLRTPPWGEGGLFILSGAARGHAFEGRVEIDRAAGRARIRVTGLPPPSPGLGVELLWVGLPAQRVTIDPEDRQGGEIDREHVLHLEWVAGLRSGGARPRAVLAVEVEDVPLDVRSADLSFEREIERRPRAQSARIFERDGKLHRSESRALIFQELELEIR